VSQTQTVVRSALAVTGIVLVGLISGIGGWLIGAKDDPPSFHRDSFEAIVESVDDDGRYGCLEPVDPTVLENFGGSVCGHIFLAAGMDASPGTGVRVRWFTTNETVGGGYEDPVETFVLQPSGPMR
jgi:hypothetical protein